MNLKIEEKREGETLTLTLSGELDVYGAPALKQRVVEALDAPANPPQCIALDLDAVNYFDSCGAAVMIGCLKRCRFRERTLTVTQANRHVRDLLAVTGLSGFFGLR